MEYQELKEFVLGIEELCLEEVSLPVKDLIMGRIRRWVEELNRRVREER